MRATADLPGSLKYLLLRLNPFARHAWTTHRETGLKFRVSLRDVVGRTILRRTSYEPGLTGWLLEGFRQGAPGVFVDVGANIGWYSLQAVNSGHVSRVVAIEPDVGNHQLLQANIAANAMQAQVQAVACAVGSELGLARLHQYKPSNLGRHSLLVDHGLGGSWVPVLTIDNLLASLDLADAPISAIKIDVEGYEPWVLAGAPAALQRAQALLVELSPGLSEAGDAQLGAMLDAVARAGFEPRTWDAPGAVPGFDGLRACQRQVTVGFRKVARASARGAPRPDPLESPPSAGAAAPDPTMPE
jgi:FkbM family methyltransferase